MTSKPGAPSPSNARRRGLYHQGSADLVNLRTRQVVELVLSPARYPMAVPRNRRERRILAATKRKLT